jgi:restriction endonuclease Mrr
MPKDEIKTLPTFMKLSVLMPADVHRRIKYAAFRKDTTVQQIMEEAARTVIDRLDEGDDELAPSRSTLSRREMRLWQERLRHLLQSGDRGTPHDVSSALQAVSKLIALQTTAPSNELPSPVADRRARKPRGQLIVFPTSRGTPPDLPTPFDARLDRVTEEFDRLIAELCADPKGIYRLRPRRFEELIAEIWKRMGYSVELTSETRDGGRDLIATRYAETRSQVLVECKKYAPERTVGIGIVQRLLGSLYQYNATQGVLTTTSTLTKDALRVIEAKPNHLTAHQYSDVIDLLWRVKMIVIPTPELWFPPAKS